MANHKYTLEQLEAAKAYLRQRIEDELSMEKAVLDLLGAFAERLIDLYMHGAGEVEIDALVEDLVAMLLDDCETLAVDEHTDRRDAIIPYVLREWKGETLEGRVRRRVGTLMEEVAAVYVAGTLLNKVRNEIVSAIKSSMVTPWQNPLLIEMRRKLKEGDYALMGRMNDYGIENPAFFEERHYGRGVPVSSLVDLQRMTRFAVGEGWMYNDWLDAKDNGAVGFIPKRGSSYPCDICDSRAEQFFYIGEDMPPFHLNCMCYVVWIYNDLNNNM